MQFLLFEGELIPASKPFAGIENRSLRYGDGFFESISIKQHRALLLEEHANRVAKAASILKMQLPVEWSSGYLAEQIARLLSANGEPANARCRLVFWRKGEGTYIPASCETSWVLSMNASSDDRFELGVLGNCGIYRDVLKPSNLFSSFKTTSALLYVMASMYLKELGLGECILLNERQEVCEGSSTNVWIVKGGGISTPTDESGCVQGVMRSHLLKVLPTFFQVSQSVVRVDDLFEADEIFFTNASGILVPARIGDRLYAKKIATQCVAILNSSLSL